MTTSHVGFQEVAELASHLSLDERLRLMVQIGAELNTAQSESVSDEAPPGSASAVLRAVREPPHLSPEDVDELEQMITAGKLLVRQEGVFDSGDSR